jgi:glucose-6-phosphate 1-dehydrogenase
MSSTGWTRLIVEKPFGHDLQSAQELTDNLAALYAEHYLYRIDHYLGKEMVQVNSMKSTANSLFLLPFQSIW